MTNTPTWTARFDLEGNLSAQQAADIGESPDVRFIYFSEIAPVVTITLRIEAPNYSNAMVQAGQMFAQIAPVEQFILKGVLAAPHRVTLEDNAATDRGTGLLSTKAVAERLEVSDARVRQLKETDPMFPQPFNIPGAAGDFYDATEILAYKEGMVAPPKSGRPRADDEQLLRDALDALVDDSNVVLTLTEHRQIALALSTTGGRYVQGKAKVLVELGSRYGGERIKFGTPGDREDFLRGYRRAQEIWRP